MSLPNLLPAAEKELTEAIDWYEARRPGLGVEFLGTVDLALHAIAATVNPRWLRSVTRRGGPATGSAELGLEQRFWASVTVVCCAK